jgi:hypothetical protein
VTRWRHAHVLWGLTAIAFAYAAGVLYQVIARVRFPYDELIWSESPFLTNMLKLHQGVELYGPAADANSFVYSPGLEYLCFALLSPLDLHLSLPACRVVNVAVGIAAALCAGWVQARIVAEITASGDGAALARRRLVLTFTSAFTALVVFKNFTADICHPDNLHALHLAGGLALAHRALRSGRYPAALGACAFLGGGVLLKQTCALGAFGVAAALAWAGRAQWGGRRSALLPIAALATTALAALWLLRGNGRFWTLELLMAQPQYVTRLQALWAFDAQQLHRLPLWAAAPFCALHAFTSANERQRQDALLWLGAGLGALPALLAYAKHFGLWNNIVVIDVWLAILVVPTLLALSYEHIDLRPGLFGSATAAALAIATVGAYPSKRLPPADLYRYGRELEASLRADFAAGRHVLVGHGTAALIRAGYRDVPLDRSNSVLEMVAGRRDALAATDVRLGAHAYDRVYLNWPTYGERIDAALMRNYSVVTRIEAAQLDEVSMDVGYINHMSPQIVVLEPKR